MGNPVGGTTWKHSGRKKSEKVGKYMGNKSHKCSNRLKNSWKRFSITISDATKALSKQCPNPSVIWSLYELFGAFLLGSQINLVCFEKFSTWRDIPVFPVSNYIKLPTPRVYP